VIERRVVTHKRGTYTDESTLNLSGNGAWCRNRARSHWTQKSKWLNQRWPQQVTARRGRPRGRPPCNRRRPCVGRSCTAHNHASPGPAPPPALPAPGGAWRRPAAAPRWPCAAQQRRTKARTAPGDEGTRPGWASAIFQAFSKLQPSSVLRMLHSLGCVGISSTLDPAHLVHESAHAFTRVVLPLAPQWRGLGADFAHSQISQALGVDLHACKGGKGWGW
jgi:hypothetical protein